MESASNAYVATLLTLGKVALQLRMPDKVEVAKLLSKLRGEYNILTASTAEDVLVERARATPVPQLRVATSHEVRRLIKRLKRDYPEEYVQGRS